MMTPGGVVHHSADVALHGCSHHGVGHDGGAAGGFAASLGEVDVGEVGGFGNEAVASEGFFESPLVDDDVHHRIRCLRVGGHLDRAAEDRHHGVETALGVSSREERGGAVEAGAFGDVDLEFAFEGLVEVRFEFGGDFGRAADGSEVQRSVEFGDGGRTSFV